MIDKILCNTCGKIFQPHKSGAKYCSRECAAQGHRKFKECPWCGKLFNKKGFKYCSRECYEKARVLPNIACPVCGKEFHPSNGQKYCSNSCWGVAQRIHQIKICPACSNEFTETYRGQIYCCQKCYDSTRAIQEKECIVCGKKFKPYASSLLTCSKECHSKYKKDIWDNLSSAEKKKRLDKLRKGEEEIISKPNKILMSMLEKKGYIVKAEYWLDGYYYDLKIGNTLIEVNPWPYHNSTWAPKKNKHSKPKDKYYHQDKTICATKHGFNIIMKWNWIKNIDVVNLLNDISNGVAQSNDWFIPHNVEITNEPTLHRYCSKGKQHIIDEGFDRDEMISKGFVEIYDAGNK